MRACDFAQVEEISGVAIMEILGDEECQIDDDEDKTKQDVRQIRPKTLQPGYDSLPHFFGVC